MRPARASGPAPRSGAQETPAPRSQLMAATGQASMGCESLAQAHEELPRRDDEDHRPDEAMQGEHEVRVVLGSDPAPPEYGPVQKGHRQFPVIGWRPCAPGREDSHWNMDAQGHPQPG